MVVEQLGFQVRTLHAGAMTEPFWMLSSWLQSTTIHSNEGVPSLFVISSKAYAMVNDGIGAFRRCEQRQVRDKSEVEAHLS